MQPIGQCSSFEACQATVFLSLTKVKTLLLHRCALQKFHMTDSQNVHDQLQVMESPITRDQTAFQSFHSFLAEVQTNASNIHVAHA